MHIWKLGCKEVGGYEVGSFGEAFSGESDASRRRVVPSLGESSVEFEQWRNRKGGREENVRIEITGEECQRREFSGGGEEVYQSLSQASDLESELERAIKAATT